MSRRVKWPLAYLLCFAKRRNIFLGICFPYFLFFIFINKFDNIQSYFWVLRFKKEKDLLTWPITIIYIHTHIQESRILPLVNIVVCLYASNLIQCHIISRPGSFGFWLSAYFHKLFSSRDYSFLHTMDLDPTVW